MLECNSTKVTPIKITSCKIICGQISPTKVSTVESKHKSRQPAWTTVPLNWWERRPERIPGISACENEIDDVRWRKCPAVCGDTRDLIGEAVASEQLRAAVAPQRVTGDWHDAA